MLLKVSEIAFQLWLKSIKILKWNEGIDFHVKSKKKIKKLISKKMKQLSHSFLIRLLPFNHSTNPQNQFVPNIVKHKHFIFPFLSFALIIDFKFWIMAYCRKSAHMQVFFHGFVSHVVHPGSFLNGRARGMLKRDNTTIAGKLFGFLISSKEIGKYHKI